MKRILIILLSLVLVAGSLAAEDEIVGFASGTFSDIDEITAYAFVTSIDALMQGKGVGGLIALDDDGGIALAWSVEGTPVDFFTEMPDDTLVTPAVVTVPVASAYFKMLGCPSNAMDLMEQNSYIMLVSVWKSNGEVLEDYRYAFAEKAIESKATAQGVEASMVYSYWNSCGYTDDQVIWSVAAGHSVDDIVLTAIRAERVSPRTVEKKDTTVMALLGVVAIILLVGTVTAILIKRRRAN